MVQININNDIGFGSWCYWVLRQTERNKQNCGLGSRCRRAQWLRYTRMCHVILCVCEAAIRVNIFGSSKRRISRISRTREGWWSWKRNYTRSFNSPESCSSSLLSYFPSDELSIDWQTQRAINIFVCTCTWMYSNYYRTVKTGTGVVFLKGCRESRTRSRNKKRKKFDIAGGITGDLLEYFTPTKGWNSKGQDSGWRVNWRWGHSAFDFPISVKCS